MTLFLLYPCRYTYCVIVVEPYSVSGYITLPCLVLEIVDQLLIRISNNSTYTFCLVPVICSENFLNILNIDVSTVNVP
jgi:hypothetical protein